MLDVLLDEFTRSRLLPPGSNGRSLALSFRLPVVILSIVAANHPTPHHLRYAQPRALGRKASDELTVPLCRTHYREVHRVGNEQA